MDIVSTREIIEILQKYEKNHGIGIITGFSDKDTTEPGYVIRIANRNEFGLLNNPNYIPMEIQIQPCKISSIFV